MYKLLMEIFSNKSEILHDKLAELRILKVN